MIGVLVLAGTTLSGALGGQVMRAGARTPRHRASPPLSARPRPLPAASVGAHPGLAVRGQPDSLRDVFALAGD
jgi:hypothetical protein